MSVGGGVLSLSVPKQSLTLGCKESSILERLSAPGSAGFAPFRGSLCSLMLASGCCSGLGEVPGVVPQVSSGCTLWTLSVGGQPAALYLEAGGPGYSVWALVSCSLCPQVWLHWPGQ